MRRVPEAVPGAPELEFENSTAAPVYRPALKVDLVPAVKAPDNAALPAVIAAEVAAKLKPVLLKVTSAEPIFSCDVDGPKLRPVATRVAPVPAVVLVPDAIL